MDRLRKKRRPLRTSFTKTLNSLKVELSKDELDKGAILDAFTKIDNIINDIKVLDNSIVDIMVEAEPYDEEAINVEIEENDKYSDEYITIRRKVNENLSLDQSASAATLNQNESICTATKSKHYKLPKLNIKPFDGMLINYLSFWSQFKKIHEDNDLEDCDKFQYLLQSVQPETRARELLESYPVTSENYSKAVAAFQERFGNKDLLVEVFVREFLKLIIANVRANGKDRLPLPDLYMKVEAYLRSLESMGLESDTNSAWLYPMVESSLPEDVLKAWQRCTLVSRGDIKDSTKSNLTMLMQFLKKEVEGEERLQLARSGFEGTVLKENVREKYRKKETRMPTAAGLFSGKELTCLFCNKPHDSKDCLTARSLSLQDKIVKVREKNGCLKCLRYGHRAKTCKFFIRCHVCSKPHTELFCPELALRKETENKTSSPELVQSTIANQQCSREVALMTLEVILVGNIPKKVRALCDSGSQKSYILKSTAKELGLKPISTENLAHALFGGARTETKPHNKFRVKLSAQGGNKTSVFEFDFLDQDVICGDIPRVPKGPLLRQLKKHKVWLSDIGPGCPKIELLIGSDIYGQLLTGHVQQLQSGLTAIQTKLGWAVCGNLENPSEACWTNGSAMLINNLALRDMKVPELWKLETIGITDPCEILSKAEEEELAHDHFIKELSRNEEGRYCVGLPWINDKQEIPSNRHVAEKRVLSSTGKLKMLNKFEDYDKVFQEWEREGVIKKVLDDELKVSGHYLPHHPVIKPDSLTTKIRPVFDASCKVERAPSLNDCLFKGPNLIEQIPSILLRFREKSIAAVADIRRAFLQIEIKETDCPYLRFLWWEKPGKIQVYRHNRVVFGLTCSPFLLGAVIRYHLANVSAELTSIAEKLSKSFYIDNCITSVDSETELEDFISKSTEILANAKMDLRMWEFGPANEINEIPFKNDSLLGGDLTTPVPVLGLRWDRKDDCLMICNQFDMKIKNLSKREILSITQGIFDPMGFLAPVLLPAKLMIQKAWSTKAEWDTPLPESIQKEFLTWYNELEYLSSLKIPRRVGFGDKQNWSLHVCCDASQNAYATVIFLRCEDENGISVRLLGAKSRLSPGKKLTIPRLDLLACVLGARLSRFIVEALNLSSIPVYFWTDSSVVLAWIRRNDQWGTFVGNRIREICKLTNTQQWLFVPSHLNPADLPSRGCNPRKFLETKWWEGPEWLEGSRCSWPSMETSPNEDDVLAERRKEAIANLNVKSEASAWFERISNFSRIVRVMAWVLRFLRNTQKKYIVKENSLSVTEQQEAENSLWLIVQRESFPKPNDSIKGLMVMEDNEGLIRVKTKIVDRDDEFTFRYPILLPAKHHIVTCLIMAYHLNNCHAGVQMLAANLREKFWIISSKRIIRSVTSKCVTCKRYTAKARTTAPVHLPLDRVRDAKVFEIIGVDLCGPLFLKNKNKVWIVLFTCAVYRAIHLELVAGLSTETFIQSLRRFIARRGRPSIIYSDNGTNFTGTNNVMKDLDWKKIQTTECLSPIRWKFIPPTAAWWGGWWERLIRTVKDLLIRVLGRSSLNFEELYTVLCDVEATINSRPLTYISDASEDLVPLTPAMFLQDIAEIGVPDLDEIGSKRLHLCYKHCQQLREQLRNRFRREYLGQLVQRSSKNNNEELKVGDVVLVGLDGQKRLKWPMARVQKFFPSRDGKARVAELRTKCGTLVRPVQKLFPLEVSTIDDPVLQLKERRSRYGRLLKVPDKLHL